jgi:uncharacterized protein YgfB (UPF0149 family)
MNKSTIQAVNQVIDLDDCPFTQYEIHGFFIGLLASSYNQDDVYEKAIKFLDLSSDHTALKLIDKLSNTIIDELSKRSFSVYSENDSDFKDIADFLSEWAYYFLIGYQGKSSSNTPEEQEILDIFDEISQMNQKYKFDGDKSSSQQSLEEINSFIVKSTLYLYDRNSND